MWFYHFPEHRQVTKRCSHGSEWIPFSEFLSETGVIHNATACTIAANEVRTLPELHGTSQVRTDVPALYLPDITPMLSRHEEPKLGEVIPPETGELDAIKTRLATPPRSWDVDTLFHIRHATRHHITDTGTWTPPCPCALSTYSCFYIAMHVTSQSLFFVTHLREFHNNQTRHYRSLPPQLLHPKPQFQALREITPTIMSHLQPARCNTRCDKNKWKALCDYDTDNIMEPLSSTHAQECSKDAATDEIRSASGT